MRRPRSLTVGRVLGTTLLAYAISCASSIRSLPPSVGAASGAVESRDLLLMQGAYDRLRISTRDTVLAVLADEIAAEAAIQGLAGATDEAVLLWMEAILLLEPAPGDTTLEVTRDNGR